jgi:hypothetical protein
MVAQSPLALLAIAGFVLALVGRRRLGGGATVLLAIGSVTFFLYQVIDIWWSDSFVANLPVYMRDHHMTIDEFQSLADVMFVVFVVLLGATFALVLAAVLVGRSPRGATPPPPIAGAPYPVPGYPAPAPDYPQSPPSQSPPSQSPSPQSQWDYPAPPAQG